MFGTVLCSLIYFDAKLMTTFVGVFFFLLVHDLNFIDYKLWSYGFQPQ